VSTALGASEATGNYSTSMGQNTIASGIWSTSMGIDSEATAPISLATGNGTSATGQSSFSGGELSEASGRNSISFGSVTKASGIESTAFGKNTVASGARATALGSFTSATGNHSTTLGFNSSATGQVSTAMGYHTIASDWASLVIGQYNLLNSTVTADEDAVNLSNAAFVIGNGTENQRSDALTVLFDGTTTIAGDLSINSDARLKANIISLGSTLAKLLQIDGKTYTMKKDENKKQKIGVLAQDIEKVFPELVSESNGVKSVNYQGLVPVLINALKEQNDRMKVQQSQIDELKTIVQGLVK
jgi:hypothetical protein